MRESAVVVAVVAVFLLGACQSEPEVVYQEIGSSPQVPSPTPVPKPTYLALPAGEARGLAQAAMVELTGSDDFGVAWWGSWLQWKNLRLQKRGYDFDHALDAAVAAMVWKMSRDEVISFWVDEKEQQEADEANEKQLEVVPLCMLLDDC